MSLYQVTLTAVVELPDGDERKALYGMEHPADCIQLDFNNDPPAFLLELCDEVEIVDVRKLREPHDAI